MIKNLLIIFLVTLNIGVSELFQKKLKLRENQGIEKIKKEMIYNTSETNPYQSSRNNQIVQSYSRDQLHLTKVIIDNNKN